MALPWTSVSPNSTTRKWTRGSLRSTLTLKFIFWVHFHLSQRKLATISLNHEIYHYIKDGDTCVMFSANVKQNTEQGRDTGCVWKGLWSLEFLVGIHNQYAWQHETPLTFLSDRVPGLSADTQTPFGTNCNLHATSEKEWQPFVIMTKTTSTLFPTASFKLSTNTYGAHMAQHKNRRHKSFQIIKFWTFMIKVYRWP